MKLEDITSAMLAEAMAIYLRIAYDNRQPPERIRELAQADPDAPLEAALEQKCIETHHVLGQPGLIGQYLWRLGNSQYPHMKLGIERCSGSEDFVFVVDTHDRDLPAGCDAYDDPAYQALIDHNRRLKQLIEARFDLAGIPTLKGAIQQYLRERCAIGRGELKTILIVDDDESIVELQQAFLEEAGYRVLPCTCGLDALARVHRDGPIDLCLLDVMMPGMDGHTCAQQLRRQAAAHFPIVYVTALPRDRVRGDLADDYVGKPFDPDHLLATIRRHIG